jgi:peroxin-6
MYIGESEANVRRVFQRARDARPCVVFFDELDSVAPRRGNQADSAGVMDRIVSQLLAELDGMSDSPGDSGVFVIGATNRPDLLDPALLRPGRFDKMLYLGVSQTHEQQVNIIRALTRKFTLSEDVDLFDVAETCPFTFTGADFYALCSDAQLKAMTRAAEKVNEKISQFPRKVSTQWWFDHVATPEDLVWQVEMQDFMAAKKELVPSVSAQEQETYRRLQSQFSAVKKEEKQNVYSNGTGKGKGKGKEKEVFVNDANDDVDGPLYDGPVYDGANTWIGQKSVQKEYDGDEEYHALYSQE